MHDYRHDARQQLKRAQDELASGDDERIKYAALELRFAMESLTYDRAVAYKEELPQSEYDTWQPKKLMNLLLDIDPYVDKDSTISFGLETTVGLPATIMHTIGAEKVLSMAILKKHYDALGNILHAPNLRQRQKNSRIDYSAWRKRCTDISDFISDVLSSPVFNSTFGIFTTTSCIACGKSIRKRNLPNSYPVKAKCPNCEAEYIVKDAGSGKSSWEPDQIPINCANMECQSTIYVFRREIVAGAGWNCEKCGGRNIIRLGTTYTRGS